MRLATITNWAYGATVLLTIASAVTMIFASNAQDRERAAVAQRHFLEQSSTSVEEDVTALSDQARSYVITGDAKHLADYRRDAGLLQTIEARLHQVNTFQAQPVELAAIADAMRRADGLLDEQRDAVNARQSGDEDRARRIIFGVEYDHELERISADIERFQYRLDQRANADLQAAIALSRGWKASSEMTLGLTGMLFLGVLYFVFKQRVLRPVLRLSDVVNRLAAQDFAIDLPAYEEIDEIGDLSQALRLFRANGLERQRLERQRNTDFELQTLLSRMTQRMQECESLKQLQKVIESFIPALVPSFAGRLYVTEPNREVLTEVCSWHGPVHSPKSFAMSACWALQRSEMHRPKSGGVDVPCEHVSTSSNHTDSICLPLIAYRSAVGLLYFERVADIAEAGATGDGYLRLISENVGLSLGNLRLRERLRELALTDPLTGLANRRRLELDLPDRLAEAESNGECIAAVMMDLDHFKRINDTHGHDVGDVVLRHAGKILQEAAREGDLAARFGGEEFLLLMGSVSAALASQRAEELRSKIEALEMNDSGPAIGQVSASFGVACAPDQCTYSTLVKAADSALYRAKAAGRNCVVVATARAERI